MLKFCRFRFLTFLFFGLVLSACGGGSSSSGTTQPAPFDASRGEGVLQSSSSVVTYATGAAGAAVAEDATLPALNSFYMTTICPSQLNPTQCTQNQTNLNTPTFGNFDLSKDPIGNNPLGITDVDAIMVTYGALNVGRVPVTVSGGIAVPQTDTPKGIILFFHGTTIQRSAVPSNFVTSSNPGGDSQSMLLAATWASQGYIVVMPDYIGLGVDTADPHPYATYPMENAQSGLAMLKAVRDSLGDKHRLPLYITGYSEGAAYALVAGHLMQDNSRYASALKVDLKNVTPVSGVFDLTGSELPFLFADIQASGPPWFAESPVTTGLAKPFLSSYLALSFSDYSGVAASDMIASAFLNCTTNNKPNCGNDGTLNGLFFQENLPDTTVILVSLSQASQVGYGTTGNTITPLLTSTYNQQLMDQDPTNPLYAAMLAADTYLFVPKFPLTLASLDMDSVVTRVNTDVAFTYMTGQNPQGPYQEILVNNNDFLAQGLFSPSPIDHTTELPFMAILALNQFNLNP